MPKKIIQIPIDDELLQELNVLCKKKGKARSALIREACATYLLQAEVEELDRMYRAGYEKNPEEALIGEAQAAMSGEMLAKESW